MEKKTIDANTKMTKILELYFKEFKRTIIKILQQAIMNMLETNEKMEVSARNYKVTKKKSKKKKNQMKNLELKNIKTKI